MALAAGDCAPEFTLPRADGGAVALAAYRGSWVVLVFLRYLG
jgi:peroxiredoxin